MRKQDSRTALRLPSYQRQKIDRLVKEGKYENLSQAVREALQEFLNQKVA